MKILVPPPSQGNSPTPDPPTMTGTWVKLRILLTCDHQRRVRTRRLCNLFFHPIRGKAKRPEGQKDQKSPGKLVVGLVFRPPAHAADPGWVLHLPDSAPCHRDPSSPCLSTSCRQPGLTPSLHPPTCLHQRGSPSSFSLDPLCVVPAPLLMAAQSRPG